MRITATVLNVRSGPGTDFRVLDQFHEGDLVKAEESHGDWLWVHDEDIDGWVHRAYVAEPPPLHSPPIGLGEIHKRFGLPGSAPCSAGRAILPVPLKLSWSAAQITRFACHLELETLFTEVFATIRREGLWPLLENFGGCYNARRVAGSAKWSTHAWGIAVDLNTATNVQGTEGSMSPELVSVFEGAGFVWGGRWSGSSRDPMHFQFAAGY